MKDKNEIRILGLTLARGGSKTVFKKNIRPICGKPLISYTIKEAQKSKFLSRYIVSTDDQEIKKVAESFGAEVPFVRPSEYSSDSASSVSAMQHAVRWVENQEGVKYDYVVELMCTNPMKNVYDIDMAIEKLIKTNSDSVIAVHQLEDHHPARIKKIIDDKIVDFCVSEIPESRRQDLTPKAYIRSGSIYALRRDFLMIEGKRYGSSNSRPYILPAERAVNIDTELDFLMAEILINKIKENEN